MPKNRACLLIMVVIAALTAALWPDIASAKPDASKKQEVKFLKKHIWKSKTAVAFWNNREGGRWALHLRFSKCGDIKGKQRRKVCRKARQSLAAHTARLRYANARLEYLTMDVGNTAHWYCIYSHERGADGWRTNTGNGYYGGLQMDRSFQQAHGLDLYQRKGTANNWTSREQMMVAERARLGIRTSESGGRVVLWQDRPRGYNPWPNTARMCGLL